MANDNFFVLHDRNAPVSNRGEDFLFQDIMPRKGLAVLLGESGSGKTQFVMYLAACLATGRILGDAKNTKEGISFIFGYPLKQGASIYIAGEGVNGITERVKSVEKTLTEKELDSLPPVFERKLPIILLSCRNAKLVGNRQVASLLEEMKGWLDFYAYYQFPIRLIVFDTLASLFDIEEENSNSEMQKVVTALNAYAQAFDCLVLVVSHPPKSNRAVKGFTRGASTLVNSADVVLELKGKKLKQRNLTIIKLRDGLGEGARFTFEVKTYDDAPAFVPTVETTSDEGQQQAKEKVKLTAKQSRVLAIIEAIPSGVNATKEEVLKRLTLTDADQAVKDGIKPTAKGTLRKQLSRALKELMEKSFISSLSDRGKETYSLKADEKKHVANSSPLQQTNDAKPDVSPDPRMLFANIPYIAPPDTV